MKRIISVFIAAALLGGVVCAQPKMEGKKGDDGWKDRMKAELVGFITGEVNLTSAEAEKFWPVYNEAKEKQHEAFKAAHDACKALSEALEAGKTGAEVKKLTDAYLDAQKAANEVLTGYLPRLRTVLPEEKVAKLFLAEEKFRRQQIHNLRPGSKDGKYRGEGRTGKFDGKDRKDRKDKQNKPDKQDR